MGEGIGSLRLRAKECRVQASGVQGFRVRVKGCEF